MIQMCKLKFVKDGILPICKTSKVLKQGGLYPLYDDAHDLRQD